MNNHSIDTQTLNLLKQIAHFFSENQRQAYLVGGSLRNILLGEPGVDWDIVTNGDAAALARSLADRLGGHYVRFHDKAYRVVVKGEANWEFICDFASLKGSTIEEDLRQRDFTIDAIAAPLEEVVRYFESTNWEPGSEKARHGATQASPPLPTAAPAPTGTSSSGENLEEGVRYFEDTGWLQGEVQERGKQNTGRPQGSPLHVDPRTPQRNVVAPLAGARSPDAKPPGARSPDARLVALEAGLIDPLNGLADLKGGIVRAVGSEVFRRDPLRMLRAVRLGMRYGLTIDSETEKLIMRDAALLPQVAVERIHDELYKILEPSGATERLRYLDKLGLLTVLIPEFIPARNMPQPYPHYWGVLEHSLEAVGALELLATILRGEDVSGRNALRPYILPETFAEIRALLQEAEEQGIFSLANLSLPRTKLAALLHDIGKPTTYFTDEEGAIHFYGHPQAGVPLAHEIMKRLGASTADRRFVQLVVAHHMRPGQLGQVEPVTARAIRRYFVDIGPQGIYVALISLADHLATPGPRLDNNQIERGQKEKEYEDEYGLVSKWQRHVAVVELLLRSYIHQRQSILPPRLISAEELMRRLKLERGPEIGQLLEQIAEAQAEGRIHSKEEAIWLAEERLHSNKAGPTQ